MQKAFRAKQLTLQKAIMVAETARSDIIDTKQKLAVAQELAEKFKAEAREVRNANSI